MGQQIGYLVSGLSLIFIAEKIENSFGLNITNNLWRVGGPGIGCGLWWANATVYHC